MSHENGNSENSSDLLVKINEMRRSILASVEDEENVGLDFKNGHGISGKWKFLKSKTVGVIPAPFSGGQPKAGVEHGPSHLVEFGLIEQLQGLHWNVDWDGQFPLYEPYPLKDDPSIGRLRKPRYVSDIARKVSESVRQHALKGQFCLTLGGDHSLAMGTISGTSSVYDDLCVVWVDAHADINTPETTFSGNLHGCPVAFLMGISGNVKHFEWLKPCLRPDRIVFIGLRDVDPGEKKILQACGIKAFSMYEVDRFGIGKVMEMALDHVNPNRDRPIHLSFDVDALDPSVVPSTGTPVRGGLSFREGHYICEAVCETGLLVAMDVMEVNPLIGDQTNLLQTVSIGCGLVRSAMGETLL